MKSAWELDGYMKFILTIYNDWLTTRPHAWWFALVNSPNASLFCFPKRRIVQLPSPQEDSRPITF